MYGADINNNIDTKNYKINWTWKIHLHLLHSANFFDNINTYNWVVTKSQNILPIHDINPFMTEAVII